MNKSPYRQDIGTPHDLIPMTFGIPAQRLDEVTLKAATVHVILARCAVKQ